MNNDILLSTKFKSIGEDATVSMPSQIKALFGMNPQIDVRLIDYGENQDVIISMASVCQHKKDIMVLYPYGGTDFGSFMLFVV